MCYETGRYAAAARLFARALEADPKAADDRLVQRRYTAACAAALAAAAKDKDGPLPEDANVRLRRQALDWLKAELSALIIKLGSGSGTDRASILGGLDHLKRVPDLAGVRDPDALARLSDHERRDWREFWSEVDLRLGVGGDGP